MRSIDAVMNDITASNPKKPRRGLSQHRYQGRHADSYADGKEAVQHHGFKFHGGSPFAV